MLRGRACAVYPRHLVSPARISAKFTVAHVLTDRVNAGYRLETVHSRGLHQPPSYNGSSGTFLPVEGGPFTMATVTFDKATRIYPGSTKPAVDALDIAIEDGEFLVLVGPSGCGKSTSLRMLAGLEDVNGGAIRIGDRDVTHLPPKDRDIAMVFQNYALYPHTCATSRSTRQAILKKRRISPTAARSTWLPSSRRTTTPALPATCGPTMAA